MIKLIIVFLTLSLAVISAAVAFKWLPWWSILLVMGAMAFVRATGSEQQMGQKIKEMGIPPRIRAPSYGRWLILPPTNPWTEAYYRARKNAKDAE